MGTLANGIKDIFSTAKTAGTNVMLCANDGTPDGHITMSDLTSVLGSASKLLKSSDDLNTITKSGIYTYLNGNNPQHAPSGTANAVVIVNGAYYGAKYAQYLFDYNSSKMFFRLYDTSSTPVYKDWQEVTANLPTFYKDYANLSALAGVVLQRWGSLGIKSISGETNIDTLDGGLYDGIGWSLGSNKVAGYLLCLYLPNYRFQVALTYGSNVNEIYHRCYNVSYGWSTWKKVTSE